MDREAMGPYGQSLRDYFRGEPSATCVVHRDDGYTEALPASVFFRKPSDFSAIEQRAMGLCRGHVLDVGAGTGCHSLALQDRGTRVLAIDISSEAIEIMSKRGVKECRHADLFEFHEGRFDTLLLMMHGIGMVEDLSGLDRFLGHARTLLRPDGQILYDSLDVRCTEDPGHLAYQESNRQAGRYSGQIRMRFEYKGQMGPIFGWLHVDPDTLASQAETTGWACQVIGMDDGGSYLAQLTSVQRE